MSVSGRYPRRRTVRVSGRPFRRLAAAPGWVPGWVLSSSAANASWSASAEGALETYSNLNPTPAIIPAPASRTPGSAPCAGHLAAVR